MSYVHTRDGQQIPPPAATPPAAPLPEPPGPHRTIRGRLGIAPLAWDESRKLAFVMLVDDDGPVCAVSLDPPTAMRLGRDLMAVAETLGECRW